jgi:hypothetical protein
MKNKLSLTSNVLTRLKRYENRQETYCIHVSSKNNILTIIELCENPLLNQLRGNKLNQFNN